MRALDDYWGAAEIGAVALVDIAAWHWMYDNPEATPAEFRAATVQIAKDVWNRYFAEIFNQRDVVLLGMWQKHKDQVGENTGFARSILAEVKKA